MARKTKPQLQDLATSLGVVWSRKDRVADLEAKIKAAKATQPAGTTPGQAPAENEPGDRGAPGAAPVSDETLGERPTPPPPVRPTPGEDVEDHEYRGFSGRETSRCLVCGQYGRANCDRIQGR